LGVHYGVRLQLIVLAAGLFTLTFCSGSCKPLSSNVNSTSPGPPSSEAEVSSSPPFPTKEPDRYQARIVTSVSLGGKSNPLASVLELTKKETFVAKDGSQRRLDFEVTPGVKLSYLQTSQGQIVMLPAKKLYASIDRDKTGTPGTEESTPGFSPDRLLNEAQPGSHYEKLGSEEINGRATTKYRVTLGGKEQTANSAGSETIIWVDESLGMPIKSETTSKSGTNDQTRYTMEVQDVNSDVDPGMFQIPSDFKKVDYKEIRTQMYSNGSSEPKHP
jgi:hypothetical protein